MISQQRAIGDPQQDLIGTGAINIPDLGVARSIKLHDWLPVIEDEQGRHPVDRALHAAAQPVVGKLDAPVVRRDQVIRGVVEDENGSVLESRQIK